MDRSQGHRKGRHSFYRSLAEVNVKSDHPSYQAWVYSALLEDFNEAVQEENILLKPCAYLHNCISDDVINDHFYDEHTEKAPAFLRKDAKKLTEFIKKYVKYGDCR